LLNYFFKQFILTDVYGPSLDEIETKNFFECLNYYFELYKLIEILSRQYDFILAASWEKIYSVLAVVAKRFPYTFDLDRAANITWYRRLKTTVRDWLTKDGWHEKLHFIGLFQCFSKQILKKILETGC
jgi:hypothetical protein